MSIRLRFVRPFGPFTALQVPELPDLAILTGINGSGKTQLLKALAAGTVAATINGEDVSEKQVLYVGQLYPSLQLSYSRAQADREEQQLVGMRRSYAERFTQLQNRPPGRSGGQELKLDGRVARVAELFGKGPLELLDEELEAFAVSIEAEGRTAHFTTDLAHVGMAHLRLVYHYLRAQALSNIGDPSLEHLMSRIGDLREKPPPWLLVSQLLEPFGFRIDGPDVSTRAAQADLKLLLRNAAGDQIEPQELSGGEQLLLALAIAQYATAAGGSFPKLLLLDESLSSLHPSIVRRALDTIEQVFVRANGIRVLVVTHAATLIALAPTGSTYEVRNDRPKLTIRSASVDVGIGLLTAGIPTMRIDPRNRRQVLVEANQDEFVYSKSYLALQSLLTPEISLEFLSCSRQAGGSSKVIELVPRLRESGLATVFGIVDWDSETTRKLPSGVFALAATQRYAIENVLLDPLLIAFTLARSDSGRKALGGFSLTALLRASPETLQSLVDPITLAVATVLRRRIAVENERLEVAYAGGIKLSIPRWALITRGHDYAEAVIEAFPQLQQHRAGPNTSPADRLVASIAVDVLIDCPTHVPLDLLTIFETIETAPIAIQAT